MVTLTPATTYYRPPGVVASPAGGDSTDTTTPAGFDVSSHSVSIEGQNHGQSRFTNGGVLPTDELVNHLRTYGPANVKKLTIGEFLHPWYPGNRKHRGDCFLDVGLQDLPNLLDLSIEITAFIASPFNYRTWIRQPMGAWLPGRDAATPHHV